MKTIEQHFADWESNALGFGYGTGEPHVMQALQSFMRCLKRHDDEGPWSYWYTDLESVLTPTVAWLLINFLGHEDMIEYGTSPRGAWLTKHGEALRQFLCTRPLDAILAATDQEDEYVHCCPEHCNCGDGDCRPHNPFWPNALA
jgi:hypothetical protein